MANPAWVKGHKKVGGRKKGTPNKITTSARHALEEVFERRGGVQALLEWSNENPTEFYRIWAKIIPQAMQHSGPNGGPIQTETKVDFSALSHEELSSLDEVAAKLIDRAKGVPASN